MDYKVIFTENAMEDMSKYGEGPLYDEMVFIINYKITKIKLNNSF